MNMIIRTPRKGLQTLIAGIAALGVSASSLADAHVVSLSNQSSGNSLQVFSVRHGGTLAMETSIPTGGIGTGSGLGSQGAVAFDHDSELIAAVNAGDNTVSVFTTRWNQIKLVTRFSSMGTRPVSVALRNDTLYVLNQGDAMHNSGIQGFHIWGGHAYTIEDGASGLSASYTNPAQISFSPNGRNLVVTEKGTNKIGVFGVDRWGGLGGSTYTNSVGATPFGFAFSHSGNLFVTEAFGGAANASAVSSYGRVGNGSLVNLSPSVPTTQTAACWAAVSPDDQFVFAANAGSGTISTYDISRHGLITLIGNSTAIPGSTPVDMAISNNGRSLYLLGANIPGIVTFRVDDNGRLTRIDTDTVLRGSAGVAFVDQN